ncbi:MAG TPA: DUF2064 domain-containing protein, partial [Burkholderiales bacterium]|nr:DUF2064 domain-containing protein [Burkholderiales bacterium]
LALADDWRRETGREALWCWPSQFDMPEVLASALVRRMPACITPGAAIWLALCHCLAQGESPLLVRLGHSAVGLQQLQQAQQVLAQGDAVFGAIAAAEYALVGLVRAVPELFAGIPWGTDKVMSATRAQARRYGCRIAELVWAA